MKTGKILTDSVVKAAKAKDKPYKLSDSGRLYLLVTTAGAKYWKWNYRLDDKDSTYTLGEYPDVGLHKARELRDAARKLVDILPFCVEDGEVSKHEFGHWLMHNLDIDLLMQWRRSNVFCITISPRPRRVWIGWGSSKLGEPRREMFMGAHYWNRIYPTLPKHDRPKFAPSCTGGSLQWRG